MNLPEAPIATTYEEDDLIVNGIMGGGELLTGGEESAPNYSLSEQLLERMQMSPNTATFFEVCSSIAMITLKLEHENLKN